MTSQFEALTTAAACGVKSSWELCGCANGVAYVQLVTMSDTGYNTIWVNTETGVVETTKPLGFMTGSCTEAATADMVKFSASAPSQIAPFASPKDGYTTVVTDDGLSTGDVTAIYLYEAETATWVKIPVVPAGGTEGQILTAHTDGTRTWEDPAVQAIMDDQVLTGGTGTNTTVTLTPTTVADQSGGDQVNYTVTAEAKIDGTTITEDPTTHVLSAANQKPDALTDAQPTPTATGNTTNLNTIFKDAAGDSWFVDANGDAVKIGSAPVAAPVHTSEVQTATDAQTSFTLTDTPIGAVIVTRNGVDISGSFTWVGGVGTYDPADNLDCVMDADDKIRFHFEKAA